MNKPIENPPDGKPILTIIGKTPRHFTPDPIHSLSDQTIALIEDELQRGRNAQEVKTEVRGVSTKKGDFVIVHNTPTDEDGTGTKIKFVPK